MNKMVRTGLAFMATLMLTACVGGLMGEKLYRTDFYSGSPRDYPALFSNSSYLYSQDKSRRNLFFGSISNVGWGTASQSSTPFNVPMMVGIHIRWYSPVEDEFWEGDGQFDTALMEKIIKDKPADLLFSDEKEAVEFTDYRINVAPNGYVVVWADFRNVEYVVCEFYAHKAGRDNIAVFRRSALGEAQYVSDSSHEQFWESMKHSKNSRYRKAVNKALAKKAQGILPSEVPYKDQMQAYHWQLKMRAPYAIERYKIWHVSYERTQASRHDIAEKLTPQYFSPPKWLELYAINTENKERYRMKFILDRKEVLQAFQEMVKRVGDDQLIEVEVFFQREPLDGQVYLRSGKERIAINSENSKLYDYPERFKNL